MADILISGIQFPKFSPHVIEIYPNGTAIAQCKGIYGKAVSVPPHGRLIDADALFEEAYKVWGFDADAGDCNILMGLILDAPTVIEASEEKI